MSLENSVRANDIQNFAQKPVVDRLDKALRLAIGTRVMCSSELQDIADGEKHILEACSIRNFSLGGHHLGHTSWRIRRVPITNKPHLKVLSNNNRQTNWINSPVYVEHRTPIHMYQWLPSKNTSREILPLQCRISQRRWGNVH